MNFRNTVLFAVILTATCMSTVQATIITVAGDPIGGGNLSGNIFTIGTNTNIALTNTWPAAESPPNAINN